jgi:hypothetical protein
MNYQYFKIWYANGFVEGNSVQGSTFQDWNNAPSDGVLFIYIFFQYDGSGIPLGEVMCGSDWYWMTPDGTLGQSNSSSDVIGEYVPCNAPTDAVVKKGKWVPDEELVQPTLELQNLMTKNGYA